jgi:hypothetical protein
MHCQFTFMKNIWYHFLHSNHIITFLPSNFCDIRYKVEVTAEHKGEKVRLLLWDELSASILKISAADLRQKMIRVSCPLFCFIVSIIHFCVLVKPAYSLALIN